MQQDMKWIIVLVAFDDPELEPQVLKERVAIDEDEHLVALLRGGHVIDVLEDDEESVIEGYRREIEKQSMR